MTYFDIPDSVTSIGENAFDSTRIRTITLPNGINKIEYGLFRNSNLESVTIGSNVTSIGDYAFYDCSNLTSIIFNGTSHQWYDIPKGDNWKDGVPTTCTVYTNTGEFHI